VPNHEHLHRMALLLFLQFTVLLTQPLLWFARP